MSRAVNHPPARDLQAHTEATAMKLYRLKEIVKLAAFATGFSSDKTADTSEVLYYVADELEGVSCDFTETIYDLVRVSSPVKAAPAKKGGAA